MICVLFESMESAAMHFGPAFFAPFVPELPKVCHEILELRVRHVREAEDPKESLSHTMTAEMTKGKKRRATGMAKAAEPAAPHTMAMGEVNRMSLAVLRFLHGFSVQGYVTLLLSRAWIERLQQVLFVSLLQLSSPTHSHDLGKESLFYCCRAHFRVGDRNVCGSFADNGHVLLKSWTTVGQLVSDAVHAAESNESFRQCPGKRAVSWRLDKARL